MTIRFETINERHIDKAAELVMNAYIEAEKHMQLPKENNYIDTFRQKIKRLIDIGSGIVAIDEDQVVGFLAGIKIEEFFGKCKGIYCPVYGHAVDNNKEQIYQKLYQHAAQMWVEDGYTNHAITIFTPDKETIDAWFWLGFGLRCVDAIKQVSKLSGEASSDLQVKKAELSDIPPLGAIHKKHMLYYRKSPIFMPNQDEDPVKDLTEWLNEENHHLWIAYDKGEPIGYMRVQPTGESFISEHPDVMNITGAYVDERYRGINVGNTLLNVVEHWLQENGYKFLGVDYESINVSGSNYWNKQFTPYTFSMVRRIDERILL